MNPQTFSKLFQQASRLYQGQEYEQALKLLTDGVSEFPEWSWKIHFWRMCMAGRLNDVSLAVSIFSEAIQAEHWYSETQLRDDSDLETLQGVAEFEQLVNICKERQQQAQEHTILERKIIEPDAVGENTPLPLLLALHGNDRNMEICEKHWVPAFLDDWLLVFPQSSQISGPEVFVWNDWELGVKEIEKHYEEVHSRYSIHQKQRIVGGFSMGGRLAVRLALGQDIRVNGFIAVSPFMPPNDSWDWNTLAKSETAKEVRGFIVVGEKDKSSYDRVKALASILKERGILCEMESYANMGHAYPDDFSKSLKRGIDFVVNG